jgi:hypothetical protein
MGFKKTSDTIAVSFGITESATDTFTQEQINLSLDPLSNEIFVVLAVDLDVAPPSGVAGQTTQSTMALTTTSKTAVPNLSDTQLLARAQRQIIATGFADAGIPFSHSSPETPVGNLDYIGIIATPNMFVQIQGANNTGALSGNGRMWGFRARADSSTYGALVQSEVLSA